MIPLCTPELKLKKVCSLGLNLKRNACYFSILNCPDGKIRLYYRAKDYKGETRVLSSDDGIHFSKPVSIWPKPRAMPSNICHNFSPFVHKGECYAVGGVVRLNKNDSAEVAHREGLYILHSRDGMSWDLLKDFPVITREHPGFIKAADKLTSDFDSFLSCVHSQGRFYLYFRLNVDVGIRSIQYASSDNLIDWSEVRPVNIVPQLQPILGQNHYGSYFFDFEDHLMGFVPCYVNNTEGFIGTFEPMAMGTWALKNWFCKARLSPPLVTKNSSFPVKGLIRSRKDPRVIYYYVHDNYLQREPNKPVNVDLYVEEKFADLFSTRRLFLNYPGVIYLRVRGVFLRIFATIKNQLKVLLVVIKSL